MRRDRFVNPYQFVPIPEHVVRRTPPGHRTGYTPGEMRYSGTVTIGWSLRTPLLLPAGDQEAEWFDRAAHTLSIPGSSVKGAVRSVHEAMFAGCLRVVDRAYTPGYRDVAATKSAEKGWRLARIEAVADGRPTAIRLCESTADDSDATDPTWVDGVRLLAAYRAANAGLPTSGDLLELDGDAQFRPDPVGRWETDVVRSVGPVRRGAGVPAAEPGDDLLLVTDPTVRQQRKTQNPRCFWIVGRLGPVVAREKPEAGDPGISDEAWHGYLRAVEGARDVREQRAGRATPARLDVTWPGRGVIARRAPASTSFAVGDALWIRLAFDPGGRRMVEEFSLAQIWRHRGAGPVRDRVPGEAMPCAHPRADGEGLCLSCEVFGGVDPQGDADPGRRQNAYAGHVRFGPAVATTTVTHRDITLAPLGEPRPGAGMFYLQDAGPLPPNRTPEDLPGQWGASPDPEPGAERQMRGRKFYWHADPDDQLRRWRVELGPTAPSRARYEARGHHRPEQLRQATIVLPGDTGVSLVQTVTVDAISAAGLQSLVAALTPGSVFRRVKGYENATFAHHLGGGRPVGLGTAVASVLHIAVLPTHERYRPSGGPPIDSILVDIGLIAERTGTGAARRAWPALMRLMDLEGLVEAHADWRPYVSYPPGERWDRWQSQRFDGSYAFFRDASGMRTGKRTGWAPLPTPPGDPSAAFDPSLPIDPRER